MRKVTQFLLFVSRGLAICAALAGVAAGLLTMLAASFTCFDTCTTQEFMFSYLGPTAMRVMTPCAALEVLAVATFLTYCVATRQARRAAMSIFFFLIGGLVGVAALNALLQHAQATLPIDEGGILIAGPAVAWAQLWGLSLTLVAGT